MGMAEPSMGAFAKGHLQRGLAGKNRSKYKNPHTLGTLRSLRHIRRSRQCNRARRSRH